MQHFFQFYIEKAGFTSWGTNNMEKVLKNIILYSRVLTEGGMPQEVIGLI